MLVLHFCPYKEAWYLVLGKFRVKEMLLRTANVECVYYFNTLTLTEPLLVR